MARVVYGFRLWASLAAALVGVVAFGTQVVASPSPTPGAGSGVSLPAGWELCILQGVDAWATSDNVANLDEWQVAEGGSTNNSASYNPYNTRAVTDVNKSPVPAIVSANGFPAFATWPAGCAATVATLLQANMAPIVGALKAGNVAPPGAFLSAVDQSPWCAPSADGTPCYASQIGAGVLLTGRAVGQPYAIKIFDDVRSALTGYDRSVSATADAQSALSARKVRLGAAESDVSVAQGVVDGAAHALRQLALYDYTNDRTVSFDANLQQFNAPSQQQLLTQVYGSLDSSRVVGRFHEAQAALAVAVGRRDAANTAVVQATSALESAQTAQSQARARLDGETQIIQAAGACTASPPNAPLPSPAGEAGASPGASTQGAAGQATSGQATSGQATSGQATSGQATSGQATSGQATSGQVVPAQAGAAPARLDTLRSCLAALTPPGTQQGN